MDVCIDGHSVVDELVKLTHSVMQRPKAYLSVAQLSLGPGDATLELLDLLF
jgi:hypothetical protein